MTLRKIFALSAWVLWFLCHQKANAEFMCSSQISYRWTKSTAVDAGSQPEAVKSEGGPKGQVEPSSVHFASVERTGSDEVAAKAALETELSRLRVRASEACKREHEAVGDCLGRKFSVHKATLESLSFASRREFEAALIQECRSQAGECNTVLTSDPVCSEIVAPAASSPVESDKKGDDKKKKK